MASESIDNLYKVDFKNLDPANLAKIASIVTGLYTKLDSDIRPLFKTWEQNALFYEGNQWIDYDPYRKYYKPLAVKNDWMPRPVTNMILPSAQAIASMFVKDRATARIVRNGDERENINAAKISEALLDAKWDIDKEDTNSVKDVLISMLFGTTFRKDFPDISTGELIKDADGNLRFTGDNSISILSPFEVYPDIYSEMNAERFFIEPRMRPISWWKSAFGRKGDGYTGLADKVTSSKSIQGVTPVVDKLKFSAGASGTSSSATRDDECMGIELCAKPHPKFPKGIYVVVAGDIVLYAGDSPTYTPDIASSWHPYSWWGWMMSPLRWHYLSWAENLIGPQKSINKIDAMTELSRLSIGSPTWIFPKGCGLPEGVNPNRPGTKLWVNPVGANGMIPQMIEGKGMSEKVYKDRDTLVAEFYQASGVNDILLGKNPTGVNAGNALNLLMEQTYSKFSVQIKSRESFLEQSQQKKLSVIRALYTQPRLNLTNKLKEIAQTKNDIVIDDFIGANLGDNITVRFEAGSSMPRSKEVERNRLLELQGRGLLGDVSTANPIANADFLDRFGFQQISGVTNSDVVKAKYVVGVLNGINNGKFGPDKYPKFEPYDDAKIQMQILTDEMKKPGFEDTKGVFQHKFNELNEIQSIINGRDAGVKDQNLMEQDQQTFPPAPETEDVPPLGAGGENLEPVRGQQELTN